MNEFCVTCGKPLKNLDIEATMKFINAGATEYQCIPCIAAHYHVTEEKLTQVIEFYRKQGCALFN